MALVAVPKLVVAVVAAHTTGTVVAVAVVVVQQPE
jgi:hypothetical protein